MKKLTTAFLFGIAVSLATECLAQSAPSAVVAGQPVNNAPGLTTYRDTTAASSDTYTGIYVGTRWLPLRTQSGVVALDYTDHSPSKDNFTATRPVKASNYAFNLDIGVEGGRRNGPHVELLLGGSWGETLVRFYAQFGYGRNFSLTKNGAVTVRPVLNVSYGNVRYKLGDMFQNDEFIQVDGKRFYSEKVGVAAVTNPLVLLPRLDVPIRLTRKIQLKLHGGYHLTLRQGDMALRFTGEDADDEMISAREAATSDHVNLRVNDRETTHMPVKLDGFTFGAGLVF